MDRMILNKQICLFLEFSFVQHLEFFKIVYNLKTILECKFTLF